MNKVKLILAILVMVFSNASFAQPGVLDVTFDTDGKLTTAIGVTDNEINSVVVQPDGKIVVAGYSYTGTNFDYTLARYNPDGSPDNNFSADGQLTTVFTTGSNAFALAIQADGKIVAAGRSFNAFNGDFALVRYNTDGTLDNSFGAGGTVTTDIADSSDDRGNAVLIQNDGKIVVAGFTFSGGLTCFALVRYDTNGALDNGFGTNGIVITSFGFPMSKATSVALQADGKILAAGYSYNGVNGDFTLSRFNTDGTPDSTFSTDGKVMVDFYAGGDEIASLAIQPDGKIIAAGSSYNLTNWDFTLARFNPDGTLDNTFSLDGMVTTSIGTANDQAYSMTLQPDGKIIVAGVTTNTTRDLALVRYNADGTTDNSFGTNGIVITPIGTNDDIARSIALQPDGKIVVAGSSSNGTDYDFAIARYLSGLNIGILEFSTSDNAVLIYPNPIQQNAILEYTLKEQEEISIQLFDMQGKMIKTFVEKERQEAGDHSQALVLPEDLSAGSYLIVISSKNGRESIKIEK